MWRNANNVSVTFNRVIDNQELPPISICPKMNFGKQTNKNVLLSSPLYFIKSQSLNFVMTLSCAIKVEIIYWSKGI